MSIARVVTSLAAAFVGFSAVSVFLRAKWIVQPLSDYGVSPSWWPWLGVAKTAGAVGLLAGLLVPVIGVLAGICLVLYFTGAVVIIIRARWYSHIAYPLIYMAVVIAALVLEFAI